MALELIKEVGKTKAMENIIYLYIFEFFMLSQRLPALQAVAQDVIQRYDGIPLQWKLLYGKDPLIAEIYGAQMPGFPQTMMKDHARRHGGTERFLVLRFTLHIFCDTSRSCREIPFRTQT